MVVWCGIARIRGVRRGGKKISWCLVSVQNMGIFNSHPAAASVFGRAGRGVLGRSLNFYTFA